jgi:large subunit ribosomal protein L9
MILPKKLGVEATPKNMNDLKLRKANEEKVARENLESAKAFAEELKTKEVFVTGHSVQVFMDKDTHELVLYSPEFYEEWKQRWEVNI